VEPLGVLQNLLPAPLLRLAPWLAPGLVRLAKRWIAVGVGCDSTVEPGPLEKPLDAPEIR